MYSFIKSSDAIFQIFTSLCLSQVKQQLTENLTSCSADPANFTCNGRHFSFIPNKSLILDESLTEYGINLSFRDRFN